VKTTTRTAAQTPVIKRITSRNRSIVGFHLYHVFRNYNEKEVFDFLPCIITREDHMILRKWMEYFREHGIPFCVTEENSKSKTYPNKKRKRLWKENKCI